MSSGRIAVATARLTARFPRCEQVVVKSITLCLAALFFFTISISGLESAVAQSAPQEDPSPARPQARSEQERADFNTAYALRGAATEEAAAIDFANRYPAFCASASIVKRTRFCGETFAAIRGQAELLPLAG